MTKKEKIEAWWELTKEFMEEGILVTQFNPVEGPIEPVYPFYIVAGPDDIVLTLTVEEKAEWCAARINDETEYHLKREGQAFQEKVRDRITPSSKEP